MKGGLLRVSGSGEPRREQLIESHLALVRAIARRYAGRGEPVEDLVQVGAIGLIKASDRFDPSRGTAFATFATPSIDGAIRHHLRDRASLLRIPRDLQRRSGELHHQSGELEAALGRTPTVRELAEAIGADERDVELALSAERSRNPIPISPGEDGIELPDESQALVGSDDRLLVAGGLRALDERERRIVLLRFHADMAEREIAREVGISQAHVSRLLAAALAKLRQDLSNPENEAATGDIASEAAISPIGGGKHASAHARSGSSRRKRPHGEIRIRRVAASEESTRKQRETSVAAGESSQEKSVPSHSGRFLVRMPSELHEQLARAAERNDVSLNRFVTDTLAASVSPPAPGPEAPQPAPSAEEPLPAVEPPQQPIGPAEAEPPLERTLAPASAEPVLSSSRTNTRSLRLALATNLLVVVLAGLAAVVLLVLALEHGI